MKPEEGRAEVNIRPEPDREMADIASYLLDETPAGEEALQTARWCLMDSIGCAVRALGSDECLNLLGPVVPGTVVPCGARVPGTAFELDPVTAAFNIGAAIRWLDFNDTWLAAEWGHPSDNLGGILAVADHVSRKNAACGKDPLLVGDVLNAMVKAYEIQGIIALENGFNRVGLDHVVLVKLATAAVVVRLAGGGRKEIVDAVSQVFVDGQSLRTYRHAPNTGSRKSWAAGDASARGVFLALVTMRGQEGCPGALSAKYWGFYDVSFQGRPFSLPRRYGSYVIENILFKVAFPAEFHAQTAAECALILHPQVRDRLEDIRKIELTTQESAIRIISKTGPLYNPADRDHCLQYIVAVALIYGTLTVDHYSAETASDPRIDLLRGRMEVMEDRRYSRDYLDPEKRSIANAVQVFFRDGTSTPRVEVEYPLGHRRRRREGLPLLRRKFRDNMLTRFTSARTESLIELFEDRNRLDLMPVDRFMELLLP